MPDFEVVYVENFYDRPLSGHAWMDKKEYVYFDVDIDVNSGPSDQYSVFRLNDKNLMIALSTRKLFEDLVGVHWSYPQNTYRANGINKKLFYKNANIFGSVEFEEEDLIGKFQWKPHFNYRQEPNKQAI